MKRPAIFFDRDNTLIVGNDYLGDPAEVRLVPGAAAAVARARRMGYATVIVSNQSGVARGLFDEAAVHAVNQRLEQLLLADDPAAVIDRHEFCPFHPDGTIDAYRKESDLRKPKPGMILRAAEAMALDLRRSWMVGDAPRDIEAGRAAGCRTILFTDHTLPPSPAVEADSAVAPDFTAASLIEAMDIIEAHRASPAVESSKSTLAQSAPANDPPPLARVEATLDQILNELRRRDAAELDDFSVSKLLAGIVQVLALGLVFMAYLNRDDVDRFYPLLLFSLFVQMLVVALLIMGRQR
jgi:D-glycero-D-manno-heptose 1,7-bisphosphate phosphatase